MEKVLMEWSQKVVGEIEVVQKVELTEDDVNSIVCGFFESTDWAKLDKDNTDMSKQPLWMFTSDYITHLLLEGEKVYFYDIEEGADASYVLTLDALIDGVNLNFKNRQHDCDLDNADAITYDCIVQYALFGEIIFG